MVFVYTAMGVLYVEHANVLELCYIELLSGDGSPYSILSALAMIQTTPSLLMAHITEMGIGEGVKIWLSTQAARLVLIGPK